MDGGWGEVDWMDVVWGEVSVWMEPGERLPVWMEPGERLPAACPINYTATHLYTNAIPYISFSKCNVPSFQATVKIPL